MTQRIRRVRPVAMNGGTPNHALIADNVVDAIAAALPSVSRDVKVLVAGRVGYPDLAVTCSRLDGQSDIVPSPVLVPEVQSSTAATDRITKNTEHAVTSSIQRYVMPEQVRIGAAIFARDGDSWVGTVFLDDAVMTMPEIGVELTAAELHAGVVLPPDGADD